MGVFSRICILFVCFAGPIAGNLHAQSVLDPKDKVVDTTAHRQQPPFGQIGKWERTQKVNWNSDSYKAYIYKGRQFRLKFPKSYDPTVSDSKKYPVYVFFHGLGEKGDIYDNDYQLYNGGLIFKNAVDSGKFDGYLLYMQSVGFFGDAEYALITELLDYMVANNKADRFRIYIDGVSGGGQATWEMLIRHPDYVTCAIPISYSSTAYSEKGAADTIRFTPIWMFQGGKDLSPSPYTTHQLRDGLLAVGANVRYTEYPTLGHTCWDSAWVEPDFIKFMLRSYSSNPWPLNGKTNYAPTETINDTIGLAPGFDQYQWRKDSVLIAGAGKNMLVVTEPGVYDARVLKGSLWSNWSPVPVKITGPSKTEPEVNYAYPVPFRDYVIVPVTVSSANKQVQILLYDMTGSLVFQQTYSSLNTGTSNLKITPPKVLSNGIYVVKIISGNGQNTKYIKLEKQ